MKSVSVKAGLACSCKNWIRSRLGWTAHPRRGLPSLSKVRFWNPVLITTFSPLRCKTSFQPFACLWILLKRPNSEWFEWIVFKRRVDWFVFKFKVDWRRYFYDVENGNVRRDSRYPGRSIGTACCTVWWLTENTCVWWAHFQIIILKQARNIRGMKKIGCRAN